MAKIIEKIIDDFSRGITNDPRIKDSRYAQLIKNFDAHTFPHKLLNFRSSESGDASASTNKIDVYDYDGTTLYGLGRSGTDSELFELTDFTANSWFDRGGVTGTHDKNFFKVYKSFVYGARAGTTLWRYNISSPGFTPSWQTLTYASMTNAIVHSKDDIMYFGYNTTGGAFIGKWDNSTFNSTALTLPTWLRVTSICEYGNYLAIACKPASGSGQSVVYLWDRDTTLSTLSESINWGEGNLTILEEIEGSLFGISFVNVNAFLGKIVFRYYDGGKARVFKQFLSEAVYTAGDLPQAKQKINDNLYFLLQIKMHGTVEQGLWKIGKVHDSESGLSIAMDRTPNNDTALSDGGIRDGAFFIIGDYVWITYYSSGTTYALSKTDDQANYTVTAYYDTVINPEHGEEFGSSATKKLLKVTAMFEPFPSGGTLVVAYKADAETSFTTILTHTTANALRHTAINIESSGVNLPIYKEITFRITATTKQIAFTGLRFASELVHDDIA